MGLGQILGRGLNSGEAGRDAQQGMFQVPLAVDSGVRSGPREFIPSTANAVNTDGSRKYLLDIQMNTLVTKVSHLLRVLKRVVTYQITGQVLLNDSHRSPVPPGPKSLSSRSAS